MQFFAILSLLAAAAIASPMVVPEKANTFPETTFTASFGSFTQTFTFPLLPTGHPSSSTTAQTTTKSSTSAQTTQPSFPTGFPGFPLPSFPTEFPKPTFPPVFPSFPVPSASKPTAKPTHWRFPAKN